MSTDNEFHAFVVNIDNVINKGDIPQCIRDLFVRIRDNGYGGNAGDYFQRLTQEELQVLRGLSEAVSIYQDQEAVTTITILAIGLALSEGIALSDDSTLTAINCVIKFIALEHLYRCGLIEVVYENWSVDPFSLDPEKVVAYFSDELDDDMGEQ